MLSSGLRTDSTDFIHGLYDRTVSSKHLGFGTTVTSNGSPHAIRDRCPVCPACLSVTFAYCGQTVGWIKMPLGTEVGLGPGHIVLHEDQAPPRKGVQQPPPHFWPMSIVAKRSPIAATAEILFIFSFFTTLFFKFRAADQLRCSSAFERT